MPAGATAKNAISFSCRLAVLPSLQCKDWHPCEWICCGFLRSGHRTNAPARPWARTEQWAARSTRPSPKSTVYFYRLWTRASNPQRRHFENGQPSIQHLFGSPRNRQHRKTALSVSGLRFHQETVRYIFRCLLLPDPVSAVEKSCHLRILPITTADQSSSRRNLILVAHIKLQFVHVLQCKPAFRHDGELLCCRWNRSFRNDQRGE